MDVGLALYKFSDAMGIPITYNHGTVSGSGSIKITTPCGCTIRLRVRALSIFAKETVGVVFGLGGTLYAVMAYYPESGVCSLYFLDSSKVVPPSVLDPEPWFLGMIDKEMGLREVFAAVRAAFLKSYVWNKKDGWEPFVIPS